MTSPIIRAVKEQWDAEVHFLTKENFQDLLRWNPNIDHLWHDQEEDLMRKLKSESYDQVLDLHKSNKSRSLIQKLGVKSQSFDKINIRKWLFVNFKAPALPDKHLVDRYFEAFEGLTNDHKGLDFYLSPSVKIPEQIPQQDYLSLAFGAAHKTKQIPEELLVKIIENSPLPIVLLGGKSELELGQRMSNRFDQITNMAGKLTLQESAAIIQDSKGLITADTGMMHIAVGLKKPTAVLWGNTVPELGMFPYYGDAKIKTSNHQVTGLSCRPCSKLGKKTCPKGHFKCMLNQDIDSLIENIQSFI